jgi:hypothetical protein
MTHRSVCKFSGKIHLPEKDATPLLEERIDAPKLGIGHLLGTESMDCDLLEATTSPKRKHSTIRRDRVQSAVQTEMEYETSGRVHQDHVERRNRRSHSPTKYYSQHVSLFVIMEIHLS